MLNRLARNNNIEAAVHERQILSIGLQERSSRALRDSVERFLLGDPKSSCGEVGAKNSSAPRAKCSGKTPTAASDFEYSLALNRLQVMQNQAIPRTRLIWALPRIEDALMPLVVFSR